MAVGDLDSVVALDSVLFGAEAWSRQMLVDELSHQPATRYYLVAEDEGAIVGYAGLMAVGSQADVLTIAVANARWGEGIGSDLIAAMLTEAVRRRCMEIFLEVRADNTRAQRLYRRWGFAEKGIRHRYYQPSGTDAIVMRRDLAGIDATAEHRTTL
jgi:[ribosomal protein S18]-alanine N-acetyltransferase